MAPDLLVLSPGPGRPSDFRMSDLIDAALVRALPLFGVCLGLQELVEHFGGTLGRLPQPMHGKPSPVEVVDDGGVVFGNLPTRFRAGRYHSLYADPGTPPDGFRVTARSADGTVMGIEHRELPMAAVQFHPESITTMESGVGHALMANVVAGLSRAPSTTLGAGSVR